MMSFLPLSSSVASARHYQVEKLVGQYRIEAPQFPDVLQVGRLVAGAVVSDREVVPGSGVVRINPDLVIV